MSSVSRSNRAEDKQNRAVDSDHTSYSELLSNSFSQSAPYLERTDDFSFNHPVTSQSDSDFTFTNGIHDNFQDQERGTQAQQFMGLNEPVITSQSADYKLPFQFVNGNLHGVDQSAPHTQEPGSQSPSSHSASNHLNVSAAAGYLSDNGPSEISARTTPSFDEDLLEDVDFTVLSHFDNNNYREAVVPEKNGIKVDQEPVTQGSGSKTASVENSASLSATNTSSYLISPVNTILSSPSIQEEENARGSFAPLFPPNELVSASHLTTPNLNSLSLSTMQQTPALTGSSKSSSHDGRVPRPTHVMSPIVKVENYSRDESPSREVLQRSFSKRSHHSQISTSHLHANFGDDAELDEDDELTDRAGYAPETRGEGEIPSLDDQDESQQIAERNAGVRMWLETSDVGTEASEPDSPHNLAPRRKAKLSGRRRAKSVGDPARTGSPSAGFDDSQIPGPGILLNVESEEEEEDDGSTYSSRTDDEEGPDIEQNKALQGAVNYFPTVEDEPLPSQFVRVRPWADLPTQNLHSDNSNVQPPTANHAIAIFNRRAGAIDRSSRVATWGTRRLSETDVDKLIKDGGILKRFSFNNKDKPKKPERKGSGFLTNILQRVPSNKRRPSEKNARAPPNRKDSESSLAPPTRSPSFPSHLGRRNTKSTRGAVAAMTTQIAAVGASSTVNATSSPPTSSPWERGKQVIKRARSGSNLTKRNSSEGLSSLLSKYGGPPVPSLASPSIDDGHLHQPQAPVLQPAVQPIVHTMEPEEDDDMDDEVADDGVKMELNVRLDPVIPTIEGFLTNVKQLNPRLAPFLAERISHEQVGRYKRLVKLKVTHLNAVKSGTCSSTPTFCPAFGGQAKILQPRVSQRDSDTPFIGFQVNTTAPSDDEEQGSFGEGTVAPAQFPQGVPLPPTRRLPAEFECPLCFKVKKFQKPSDWTKHVHEDVQPFTCTWARCAEPKSFKRKADWVRHENERHRKLEWWTCDIPECSHTCYRKDNFVQHLVREHKMTEPKVKTTKSGGKTSKTRNIKGPAEAGEDWAQVTEDSTQVEIEKLWELVERCRHDTTKKPQEESCKFCGNVCSTWKKLTVHLARHMEQISLPVLSLVEQRNVTPDTLISPIGQPVPSALLVSPVTPSASSRFETLATSPYDMSTVLPTQSDAFTRLKHSASPGTTGVPDQPRSVQGHQTYPPVGLGSEFASGYGYANNAAQNDLASYRNEPAPSFTAAAYRPLENNPSLGARFVSVNPSGSIEDMSGPQLYYSHENASMVAPRQQNEHQQQQQHHSQSRLPTTNDAAAGAIQVPFDQQHQQSFDGLPISEVYGFRQGNNELQEPQINYGIETAPAYPYSQGSNEPPIYHPHQYQ